MARATDTHAAYQQQSHVNASDFFIKMRKKAKNLADEVALKRTSKMLDILRHRKIMENVGGELARWPKWDDVGNKKSKKSYSFWEAQERPNGEFWIVNKVTGSAGTASVEEYNYPRSLATGKGWPARVKNGELKRLVRNGGLIFSTQMPRGLDPWLQRQRQLFEEELKDEFRKRGIK